MSIRSSLLANPDGKSNELAESATWIPLQWFALISADDVERCGDGSCISTDRRGALDRFDQSITFLGEQFPEFESFEECADALRALLRKSSAKTIGLEVMDHIGMNPETFMPSLLAGVSSLQAQDDKCAFTVPERTVENPFAGAPMRIDAVKHETIRDVLCFAASLDPMPDDEVANEQLIGCIF